MSNFSIRKYPGATATAGSVDGASTGVVSPETLLYYDGKGGWTDDKMQRCLYPMANDAFNLTCAIQAEKVDEYNFFGACVWDDHNDQLVPPPNT